MENIGERTRQIWKSWQEKQGSQIKLMLEQLGHKLRASSETRIITVVVITLCGIGGFWFLQEDEIETASLSKNLEPASVVKVESRKNDRLEVVGASALAKEPLRNPFLPTHPTKGEKSGSSNIAARNIPSVAKGKTTAGGMETSQQAGTSGMPIPVPVKQPVEKEHREIYLQGIINTEETPGALLTLEGQSRFLLAGESWQGYVLDSVLGEQASINGHLLQVGDRLAM